MHSEDDTEDGPLLPCGITEPKLFVGLGLGQNMQVGFLIGELGFSLGVRAQTKVSNFIYLERASIQRTSSESTTPSTCLFFSFRLSFSPGALLFFC